MTAESPARAMTDAAADRRADAAPSPRADALAALCRWLRPRLRARLTADEADDLGRLLLAYARARRQRPPERRTAPPAPAVARPRRTRTGRFGRVSAA